MHVISITRDRSGHSIKGNCAKTEYFRTGACVCMMTKRNPDPGEQLISVERLYDVIIGAQVQRRDLFPGFVTGCQDDNRTAHRL